MKHKRVRDLDNHTIRTGFNALRLAIAGALAMSAYAPAAIAQAPSEAPAPTPLKVGSHGLPLWVPDKNTPTNVNINVPPVYRIREAPQKPFASRVTDAHVPNVISLKFKDGLAVQLVDGQFNLEQKQLPNSDLRRGLAALTREAQSAEPQTLSQLLREAGGAKISPLVTKSPKEHDAEMTRLNLYSPVPLADLSTYFTLYLHEKFDAEASMRLINQLNALDAVELAEAWPKNDNAFYRWPATAEQHIKYHT